MHFNGFSSAYHRLRSPRQIYSFYFFIKKSHHCTAHDLSRFDQNQNLLNSYVTRKSNQRRCECFPLFWLFNAEVWNSLLMSTTWPSKSTNLLIFGEVLIVLLPATFPTLRAKQSSARIQPHASWEFSEVLLTFPCLDWNTMWNKRKFIYEIFQSFSCKGYYVSLVITKTIVATEKQQILG